MPRYTFSTVERFAVFKVHGPKCYMCGEPITLKTMQVDHVIPEHLLSDPNRLAANLTELGLPLDFDLNSYENWLPCCGSCNNEKRGNVYGPVHIHLAYLKRAGAKAADCVALAAEWKVDAEIDKALAYLEAASEKDQLDYAALKPLIVAFAKADPRLFQATVAVALEDVPPTALEFTDAIIFAISPGFAVAYEGETHRLL
ncbi:HNH endonuclease [Ensifer sp. BR816]|uniref:HNH endonuclease n=1 Tax=Rhizobium sp. (strain BR816) TaxID=1057002 RepID=UPI0012FAF0C6|nr:HNH endonuclease signature motif containing protein [Ensifer sp. BR816]